MADILYYNPPWGGPRNYLAEGIEKGFALKQQEELRRKALESEEEMEERKIAHQFALQQFRFERDVDIEEVKQQGRRDLLELKKQLGLLGPVKPSKMRQEIFQHLLATIIRNPQQTEQMLKEWEPLYPEDVETLSKVGTMKLAEQGQAANEAKLSVLEWAKSRLLGGGAAQPASAPGTPSPTAPGQPISTAPSTPGLMERIASYGQGPGTFSPSRLPQGGRTPTTSPRLASPGHVSPELREAIIEALLRQPRP